MKIKEGLEQKINNVLLEDDFKVYYIDQEKFNGDDLLVVYVQKSDINLGMSLDDIVLATRKINEFIDDYIDSEYILEVSSAGTNRGLFTDEQLKAVIGDDVEVRLTSNVEGTEKKKHIGELEAIDTEEIVVDGIIIPRRKIKKINYVGRSND